MLFDNLTAESSRRTQSERYWHLPVVCLHIFPADAFSVCPSAFSPDRLFCLFVFIS